MCMNDTNSSIEQRKARLAVLRGKGNDSFQNRLAPSQAWVAHAHRGATLLAGHATTRRDAGKSIFNLPVILGLGSLATGYFSLS